MNSEKSIRAKFDYLSAKITKERHLEKISDELKHNGYTLSRDKSLKDFKLQFGHLIDKAIKTTQLGLFNFRFFLNLAMRLVESEKPDSYALKQPRFTLMCQLVLFQKCESRLIKRS